jgi:hypothetical protein
LYSFQRFGSGSVSTHFLGAALLGGEWESTAVSKILDPREGDILSLFLCSDHQLCGLFQKTVKTLLG